MARTSQRPEAESGERFVRITKAELVSQKSEGGFRQVPLSVLSADSGQAGCLRQE
jgi:hypothetical protein